MSLTWRATSPESMPRRIGAKEEESFFTGDGTGKPLGILAATGGAETGITAASATAITADELIDLFYSLKAPYRRNAVWVLNDSTIKAIRKLKDNQGQYLWQPSLTAGAPDLLLGKPVRTSAYMPAIAADAKTIAFGDSAITGSLTARVVPSSASTNCMPLPDRLASCFPACGRQADPAGSHPRCWRMKSAG